MVQISTTPVCRRKSWRQLLAADFVTVTFSGLRGQHCFQHRMMGVLTSPSQKMFSTWIITRNIRQFREAISSSRAWRLTTAVIQTRYTAHTLCIVLRQIQQQQNMVEIYFALQPYFFKINLIYSTWCIHILHMYAQHLYGDVHCSPSSVCSALVLWWNLTAAPHPAILYFYIHIAIFPNIIMYTIKYRMYIHKKAPRPAGDLLAGAHSALIG